MLFYFIVALVAIRARRFLTVFIWAVLLQIIATLLYFATMHDTAEVILGTLVGFLIKVLVGYGVYRLFRRKQRKLPEDVFHRQRRRSTIFVSIAVFVLLIGNAYSFYSGIQRGQELIIKAKEQAILYEQSLKKEESQHP